MINKIKLILGTMNFGPQVATNESRDMVQRFVEAGYHEVDTAHVYNEGEAENILGSITKDFPKDSLYIATKVHPKITGKLDGAAVTCQLNKSLLRLGKESVDLLYFHFPDRSTPIEDALKACSKLHKQGKFNEFGLSNFPAWMVVDIWHICKKNGWLAPSVYQGRYNALSRKVEGELFPALRKLDMRFYAYNPLAGGMLTGRYSNFNQTPTPGRFTIRPNYCERYWKKSFFNAVDMITEKCREVGLEPADAAFRWLAYHSLLKQSKGDGIIIGASNMCQFEQNLSAIDKGPLPENIVWTFNTAWEEVKPDCPDYFNLYSTDKISEANNAKQAH
jgi:aflatoxin B1 aldehyde reductase